MKKAILYARVATEDQREGDHNKMQMQISEMKTFCENQNIEIVVCYCEVASGASFNSRVFNGLFSNIENGNIKADMLLITRWDRFSRNLTSTLEMMKKLRAFNIKVQTIQDYGLNDFEIIIKHATTTKK